MIETILRASLLVCLALPLAQAWGQASKRTYPTAGDCAGLPKVDLGTPPGFCVGLVIQGLRFPRGIAPLPNGDLIVAEMGSWEPSRGAVTLLVRTDQGYRATRLFQAIDRPHGVALGPDRQVYVGEVGGIFRFDPRNPVKQYVVGGDSGVAPLPQSGRHPLINLVFDKSGDLFVGLGSESDNCDKDDVLPDAGRPCPETTGPEPRGVIRKYVLSGPQKRAGAWSNFASGLRNSLGIAIHPQSNRLLQAENSRDAIHRRIAGMSGDEDLPHDELNLIEQGAHYGWPYCYDAGRPSPEYPKADCAKYRAPILLLPAHAAPLGMTYYAAGNAPAEYAGNLLVTYHGYRRNGHRVVAIPVDDRGMPAGPARDLVNRWSAHDDRPMGTPVDIKAGRDGALFITEDRNGTVLRLVYVGK